MDLLLERHQFRSDGIFSGLYRQDNGSQMAVTLEHAYLTENGYEPKIPQGTFTCVRGTHCLHNGVLFETFEVTGVSGHTNLLFHAGNFNQDSEGCILLGHSILDQPNGTEMITQSKDTFAKFMALQQGVKQFTLTVR